MNRFTAVLIIASSSVSIVHAASLDVVEVGAPAINCKFDADCTISPMDLKSTFVLAGSSGEAFLQSRRFPPGEPGTPGEGLYPYLYRISLIDLVGTTAMPCVHTFSIEFGPIVPLDYDDDGNLDDVYVITRGSSPGLMPTAVERTGNVITFQFDPSICAGDAPGGGDASYMIGLASPFPERAVTAHILDTLGDDTEIEARAPEISGGPQLFVRGDANADGITNIADPIVILNYLFAQGSEPSCLDSADIDDNGVLDIGDPIRELNALFSGGPEIAPPYPACGLDPTPDDPVDCVFFPRC
jgi:hypothetical protein